MIETYKHNRHNRKETKMKKFNAAKIVEFLNQRMAAGLGYHSYTGYPEICGTSVIIVDFDRGGKLCDMNDEAAEKEFNRYKKMYKGSIEFIESNLKDKGWAVKVDFNMDEKGWCQLDINPAPGTKVVDPKTGKKPVAKKTKKSTKKSKKLGVIATIRKSIKEKALTQSEILDILIASFPEREAAKMTNTIKAQLPKRILKDGDKMICKKEIGQEATYKIK